MMTTYSSLIKTLEEMDVMQVVVIRGVLQVSIMGGILESDINTKLKTVGPQEQLLSTRNFPFS